LDKNVSWSLMESVLQAITPSTWEKIDVQKAELERLEMIRNMPLVHTVRQCVLAGVLCKESEREKPG